MASSSQTVDFAPPVTVVIGTGEGWPYVRELVGSLRAEAEELGAEVVVADGSGNPPPTATDLGPSVRWLTSAGDSVFALYVLAMRAARADIVALTEDHARPRPGWIAAALRAHTEHPQASAIGGAIENGTTDGLLPWASYFTTQGPHMAPLGNREVPATTNEANVSYKREALEQVDPDEGTGFMAVLYNRRLAESGRVLRVDDRMVVDHYEATGFASTTALHFHNGRSVAGFRRTRGMSDEDWVRMMVALMLPAWRTLRALRVGLAKGRMRRQLLASAPFALWLEYVQGIGHLTGYVAGPGDSPQHMR